MGCVDLGNQCGTPDVKPCIRIEMNLSLGSLSATGSDFIGVHGQCTSMGSGELDTGPPGMKGLCIGVHFDIVGHKAATILTSVE